MVLALHTLAVKIKHSTLFNYTSHRENIDNIRNVLENKFCLLHGQRRMRRLYNVSFAFKMLGQAKRVKFDCVSVYLPSKLLPQDELTQERRGRFLIITALARLEKLRDIREHDPLQSASSAEQCL